MAPRSKWTRWITALILPLLAAQVYLSTHLNARSTTSIGRSNDDRARSNSENAEGEGLGEEFSSDRGRPGISDRMARDLMNYAIWNVGMDARGSSSTTGESAATSSSSSSSSSSWPGVYNHTFPRWDEDEGIDMTALMQYIRQVGQDPASRVLVDKFSPFSEVPFVVDSTGVYLSLALRNQIPRRQIRHRIFPVQRSVYRAWRHLMMVINRSEIRVGAIDSINNSSSSGSDDADIISSDNETTTAPDTMPDVVEEARARWPNLMRVVQQGGGFPFVLWEGDFRSCNYPMSTKTTGMNTRFASVPIFTTCAHIHCSHAFPFPTYETISELLTRPQDWQRVFHRYHIRYPWHNKTQKLLWRGSLSGPLLNYTSPRARLALFATKNRHHPLLDVGLFSIPSRHWPNRTSPALEEDAGELEGNALHRQPHSRKLRRPRATLDLAALLGPNEQLADFVPSSDFARYAAILDTDGNSWSSRFGRLLCTNSVVLKVEPQYVDYFYKYLEPWVHYVPVKQDLSDLLEKVEWALHPLNYERVQSIIGRANQFCAERMIHASVTRDILDIFEAYVKLLDRHDPKWNETWIPFQRELLSSNNSLQMLKMTGRKCRYTLEDECYVPDDPPEDKS